MYNEDRKREFLNVLSHKADIGHIKRVFEASSPYEADEEKDLCEFDKMEILHLFLDMEIVRLATAQGSYVALRKYCKWCMEQNFIPEREMIQISADELQNCLREMPEIISYRELQRNESLLLNLCDQLILESIYLGIKGNDYCELVSMSEKDIDTANKTISLCTGRTVKVTDRFIDLCIESAGCYDYYLISGQRQKMVGDLPIKRNAQIDKSSGRTKNRNVIGGRLNRFKRMEGFKSNLGTTMLYDSGFVNTCKEAMEQTETSDFVEFMKTDRGREIYDQYGFSQSATARWNKIRKYKGYFE